MFVDNSFKDFNLTLLFCYTILIFVNNQLNDMNMIILFSNFDKISKIDINVCVSSFGVCSKVSFSVNNVA